jgi:membrane fusion protein, multidrug efflux system
MKAVMRLAVAALLVAPACGDGHAADAAVAAAPPPVPVTVGRAERRDVTDRLRAVGTVRSPAAVTLKPRIRGEVAEVRLAEGMDVRAGDVLILLDRAPFEAALAAAEAALQRDTVMAEDLKRNADSWDSLSDSRAVSQRGLEEARAEAAAAQANVAMDQAAVDAARIALGFCEIRAPFDGRAGRVLVRKGSSVTDGETELVSIQQITPIRVEFALPDRYLAAIQARRAQGDLLVEVSVAGRTLQGTLSFIDNSVDTTTGTILLWAQLDNADRALWPGQLVDVALTVGVYADAVVVPAGAVVPGQAGSLVFVVGDDGTVQPRDVTVLRREGELVVLGEGLDGGETVVTDGQLRLVPGARVEARTEPP